MIKPSPTKAALVLPTTACDQQQVDFQIYGTTGHLTDTSQREDGVRAFAYGAAGSPFVSGDNSGVVTFNFHTLFSAPTSTISYVKLMGFSADCAPIYGLGPSFSNPVSPGDHILTYADSGHTVTFDGETQISRPSATARYIWIEAWDGVTGSSSASYSYLVDVQDVKNPTDDSIPPEPSGKRPVLIVPGILGTELLKNQEKLWPDGLRMVRDWGDEFMNPLAFESNLVASDSSVGPGLVVSREVVFDYSEGLINTFLAQGYVENENLFTFPYDWRYGITGTFSDGSTNSERLRLKIQEILDQTHFQKIDIVAHSMGGLIVKQYVMDHLADHNINKAVLVGVPNLGAAKVIKVLTEGDNMNIYGLSEEEMKKIAANMPGVYDLLPSQSYFNSFGSPIRTLTQNSLGSQVATNLDYSQARDFLISDHNLNATAYERGQTLHSTDFDNYDMRDAGVDVYTITGCKSGTLGTYTENRITGTTIEGTWLLPDEASGDGTVPYDSANTIPAEVAKRLYAIKADHGKMLSQNGIRQEIVNLISGNSLPTGDNIVSRTALLADPNLCKLNGKGIKVLSPVDIEVIDSFGNRLGVAEDGSLQNDIPGADFTVSGGHKFVYLPQGDGETYSISLSGAGTGTFTIHAQDIVNDVAGGTEVFPNLPVTPSFKGAVDISSESTALELDNNGDGVIDQTVAPSVVLDPGIQSEDFTPPLISILSPVSKDYLRSETLSIQTTIADPDSGVQSSLLKFDNLEVGNSTSKDLFFESLGNHSFTASAVDAAGNATSTTVNFRIITTIDSAISDIERAYSLGWITKKFVKDTLTQKLKAVVKLEKRIEEITEKINGKSKVVKRIERIEKKIDKTLLKLLLVEFKLYRGKFLNNQAYNLLTEDINWLLNN